MVKKETKTKNYMNKLWYISMRAYISLGFSFYYKKILIKGKKNITKNKAIVFISNHPNALIDPLLIATKSSRIVHYLTQAAAFIDNTFVKTILTASNMLPVYRIKDGISSEKLIAYNEKTFEECFDILNNKEAVLIYVEGSHNFRRKVRPFKKGFARIVFGSMDKYKDLEIDIIPVGMNYSNIGTYGSKVSVNFGEPIAVKPFWKIEDRNDAIIKIKEKAESKLKLVTNHITDSENYDKIIQYFEPDEFLYPEKVNKKLHHINLNNPLPAFKKRKSSFNLLEILIRINSFFPLLIWNKIKATIKEKEYISTFRFSLGLTAFPLFYLLQSIIIGLLTTFNYGILYFFTSILLMYIFVKIKK